MKHLCTAFANADSQLRRVPQQDCQQPACYRRRTYLPALVRDRQLQMLHLRNWLPGGRCLHELAVYLRGDRVQHGPVAPQQPRPPPPPPLSMTAAVQASAQLLDLPTCRLPVDAAPGALPLPPLNQ